MSKPKPEADFILDVYKTVTNEYAAANGLPQPFKTEPRQAKLCGCNSSRCATVNRHSEHCQNEVTAYRDGLNLCTTCYYFRDIDYCPKCGRPMSEPHCGYGSSTINPNHAPRKL